MRDAHAVLVLPDEGVEVFQVPPGSVDVLTRRKDLLEFADVEDAAAVLHVKGAGDKADAEAMRKELVDADDDWSKLRLTIQERWLRAPKASFVYSVKM